MIRWVVSISFLDAALPEKCETEIVALLSVRDEQYVRRYLSNLYYMCRASLREQKDATSYVKPKRIEINPSYCDVYYADLPYIFRAQKSQILGITEKNEKLWLRWQGIPHQNIKVNPDTHEIIFLGEIKPEVMEAPQADMLKGLFCSKPYLKENVYREAAT